MGPFESPSVLHFNWKCRNKNVGSFSGLGFFFFPLFQLTHRATWSKQVAHEPQLGKVATYTCSGLRQEHGIYREAWGISQATAVADGSDCRISKLLLRCRTCECASRTFRLSRVWCAAACSKSTAGCPSLAQAQRLHPCDGTMRSARGTGEWRKSFA